MKKKISFLTAMIFIMTLFSACTESSGGEPEYTEAPPVTAETSVTEETLPAETTVTLREDTIPNICSSRYGYYSLNADEKSVYDEIVNGIPSPVTFEHAARVVQVTEDAFKKSGFEPIKKFLEIALHAQIFEPGATMSGLQIQSFVGPRPE